MEPMPKLDRQAYIAQLRQQVETMLGQVADAINNAEDGEIIAGSECQVRDLFGTLRRTAFEVGLQMRTDAAEGDDLVLGVRGEGLADRQRPDGIVLQNADPAAQGFRHALGRGQRRSGHGLGIAAGKRLVGDVLANPNDPNDLTVPERFARPWQITSVIAAVCL